MAPEVAAAIPKTAAEVAAATPEAVGEERVAVSEVAAEGTEVDLTVGTEGNGVLEKPPPGCAYHSLHVELHVELLDDAVVDTRDPSAS